MFKDTLTQNTIASTNYFMNANSRIDWSTVEHLMYFASLSNSFSFSYSLSLSSPLSFISLSFFLHLSLSPILFTEVPYTSEDSSSNICRRLFESKKIDFVSQFKCKYLIWSATTYDHNIQHPRVLMSSSEMNSFHG